MVVMVTYSEEFWEVYTQKESIAVMVTHSQELWDVLAVHFEIYIPATGSLYGKLNN